MNPIRTTFVIILAVAAIFTTSYQIFGQVDESDPPPSCFEKSIDAATDSFNPTRSDDDSPVRNAEHLVPKELVYGPHTLLIRNFSDSDILVKLEDWYTKAISRLVFIRKGCKALILDLRGGVFRIKTRVGVDYSRESRDFRWSLYTDKITKQIVFDMIDEDGKKVPTERILQIGRVKNPNLTSESISKRDF